MVSADCMNAMYMGVEDPAKMTTTMTWSSRTEFEICCFIDASELMRILVENGYNAALMVNEDAKTRKKKPYLVSVVYGG
jgi:hypothetical protein